MRISVEFNSFFSPGWISTLGFPTIHEFEVKLDTTFYPSESHVSVFAGTSQPGSETFTDCHTIRENKKCVLSPMFGDKMAHLLCSWQQRWRLSPNLFFCTVYSAHHSVAQPDSISRTSPEINEKFFWRWELKALQAGASASQSQFTLTTHLGSPGLSNSRQRKTEVLTGKMVLQSDAREK